MTEQCGLLAHVLHGGVVVVTYSTEDVEAFWLRVEREGGPTSCWEWTGRRNPGSGMGYLTVGPRQYYAHRFAYQVTYGSIPVGMLVLHDCDNPACCNPAHLWLGTRTDMMLRRRKRSPQPTSE